MIMFSLSFVHFRFFAKLLSSGFTSISRLYLQKKKLTLVTLHKQWTLLAGYWTAHRMIRRLGPSRPEHEPGQFWVPRQKDMLSF